MDEGFKLWDVEFRAYSPCEVMEYEIYWDLILGWGSSIFCLLDGAYTVWQSPHAKLKSQGTGHLVLSQAPGPPVPHVWLYRGYMGVI